MKIRDLVIFIVGVGVGIGASYNIIKKKHDEILEEEIASVKEAYSKKNEETDGETEEKEPETEESVKEKYEKLVEEYSEVKSDVKKNEVNSEIYEITYDEYGDEGYEEIELTYYVDDNILTDDRGDLMEELDIVASIGTLDILNNRENFECVYVRNTEKECDYEITITNESYRE